MKNINSLYHIFKADRKKVSENRAFKIYNVTFEGRLYNIWVLRRAFLMISSLGCWDDYTILRRWFRFLKQSPAQPIVEVITKIPKLKNDETNIIIVRGIKPDMLGGVDEGIFSSVNRENKDKKIYVMTLSEFKKFNSDA